MSWVRETTATDTLSGNTRKLKTPFQGQDGFYKGQFIQSKYSRKIGSTGRWDWV